jgi:predicted glycoside hydrolase/deacetylase ChbG (UPF0249 family)
MKYLIVNGDDFGETPGVTAGILEAHASGILTSTSMLVTTPFAEAAAKAAAEFAGLSVGLHLCLTDHTERLVIDPGDRQACRSELRKQFDHFLELVQASPTHLDSHHNVHRDPRLEPLFLDLAEEHSLPMREHSPVRYFSSFYGQWDGETHLEQISVEMLASMLQTEVGDGLTELSCHPARVDQALASFYLRERETELETLCNPSIRALIEELGISLIGFRDLGAALGNLATSAHAS